MGFGADMMLRPRRPRRLQHRDDHIRHLVKINRLGGAAGAVQRGCFDHVAGVGDAEDLVGFDPPVGDQVTQRPAGRLVRPFGQGGLLVEPPPHLLRRVPAMVGPVGAEQLGVVAFDALPPFREHGQQVGRDAVDLPDRPAAGLPSAGAFGEGDAEPGPELVLDPGVVPLRDRHRRREQLPAVQRPPGPVDALDLVRHRDMGVEIRVAGPGVPVMKHRRGHPGDIDLRLPPVPRPGERRMGLQPVQAVRDGGGVGVEDRLPGRLRPDPPQHRHRLHRGEHQVVTGHRLPPPRPLLRGLLQLDRVDRRPTVPAPILAPPTRCGGPSAAPAPTTADPACAPPLPGPPPPSAPPPAGVGTAGTGDPTGSPGPPPRPWPRRRPGRPRGCRRRGGGPPRTGSSSVPQLPSRPRRARQRPCRPSVPAAAPWPRSSPPATPTSQAERHMPPPTGSGTCTRSRRAAHESSSRPLL